MIRNRWIYGTLIVATVLAGLSTRALLRPLLGSFWAGNLGDLLWAVLVFLLIVFRWQAIPSRRAALACAVIATAVELSQLYHPPWLDDLRRHPPAGLVLGYRFAWGDLLAYCAGAGLCWGLELVGAERSPQETRGASRDGVKSRWSSR